MLFKNKVIISLILLIVCLQTASAAQLSVIDPHGIGKYEQPSGYSGSSTDNLFVYGSGTSVYWSDSNLISSSATLTNVPYAISDVCADYNYIYIVTYNGYVYRVANIDGVQDFEDLDTSGLVEYGGSAGYFATSGDYPYRIDTDAVGNIYVSCAPTPARVTIFDSETLSSTLYQSGITSYGNRLYSIYAGTHLYLSLVSDYSHYDMVGLNQDIFYIDEADNMDYQFSVPTVNSGYMLPGGLAELTNGNIIIGCLNNYDDDIYIYEYYPNGTEYGQVAHISNSNCDELQTGDLIALPNGIIIHLDEYTDKLTSFYSVSGIGGYFVPTTPEEPVDNSSNYIQFEHDSYVSGEKAKITYNIIDEDWEDSYAYIGYDFDIQILDPSGDEIYTYDLPTQNGSTYFQFYIQYEVLENGPYTVNLIKSWLGNLDSSIIATDRTTLGDYSDSTIDVVPLTVNYGENFSIKYTYGFNPNTTVIKLMSKDDANTNMWTTRYTIPVEADANTEYTITAPELYITGEWLAGLYGNGNLLDSDTFTVYKEYSNVITTVYNSSVIISPESFIMGEYVNGRTAISDDALDSGNDIYLQFVNLDEDLICFSVPMPYQIQTFNFKLGDFDYWEYTTGDTYYIGDHSTIAGNNQIRLAAYSGGNLVEVLASDNFTVTSTNTAGYGLTLSSSEVAQNQQFVINVIAPDDCSLYLSKIGSVSNTHIASWDLNGSVSFPYSLVVTGNYQFVLTDGNDRIQATQYLTVTDSGSSLYSGDSEDYTSSGNWGNDIITNLINFLILPAFWGFVLWSGLTIGMIQRRDRNGNAVFDLKQVGIVSVLACNILAIAGLWSPYTWYIVIISWLLLAIGFYGVGRQFSGED